MGSRFSAEIDVVYPGRGTMTTRDAYPNLEDAAEFARNAVLSADGVNLHRIRIFDGRVELFAVAGRSRRDLVQQIDEWAADLPPLCDCGELLHPVQLRGRPPEWGCASCEYRVPRSA